MAKFVNRFGSPIRNGQDIHYVGCRGARRGVAMIMADRLYLMVEVVGGLAWSGFYWELDGEPCYDLI